MIRKLKSGEYRLYSRKKNPKTNKRRNLGTFSSLKAAQKHEKEIQYFKRHWSLALDWVLQFAGIMGAWEITMLIIAEVLLTLAVFSAIIALIVFSIRKPIRRHKPVDMLIFEKIKPGVNTVNNKIMLFITFLGKHQFLIPANLVLIFYFLLITRQNWFSIRVITIAISRRRERTRKKRALFL